MKQKIKILIFVFFTIFLLTNFFTSPLEGKQKDIVGKCDPTNYDLLIIAPEAFSSYLIPLAEHKNNNGVKTKIVTTDEIYVQMFWQGRDDAEKVKYFIKKAHEEWEIKYVLFVGGRKDQSKAETWWVPVRYAHVFRHYEGHENLAETKLLTDLYFADIYDNDRNFSSWNDDNDDIFGEWQLNKSAEDTPDLYPDISVGRLPCRNIIDVKIIVNKIINYESGIFNDSWFKKMLVAGGDTYPKKTEYIDGENYTQQAIDIMSDFESVKLWSSTGNLHWKNIVKELNLGCGFVFFSGHGSAAGWTTIDANDSGNWVGNFRLKHMNLLHNKKMLPVCISGSGCFNNMFNVSLRKTFNVFKNLTLINRILNPILKHIPTISGIYLPIKIPRCWGWNLARLPYGGSIATIAATGYSYESCDIDSKRGGIEWLDIHFFEEYQNSKTKILGDCWGNTISKFLQNFSIDWNDNTSYGDALIVKNVEQWLLIGDPSLKIGGYEQAE